MKKRVNHLWIEKENDLYTISLTPELQEDVGTVAYLELTTADSVEVDDILANIEASKMVMGIQSPLAGRVVSINQAAVDSPGLLNSEQPRDNWLLKLTDVDEASFAAFDNA